MNAKAIESLRKWNEEMARKVSQAGLEDKLCGRLEQIFMKENFDESIKGKEGRELYSKLSEKISINKEEEQSL